MASQMLTPCLESRFEAVKRETIEAVHREAAHAYHSRITTGRVRTFVGQALAL